MSNITHIVSESGALIAQSSEADAAMLRMYSVMAGGHEEECQEPTVLAVIPQNLLFKHTSMGTDTRAVNHDILHHTASNADLVHELEQKLANFEKEYAEMGTRLERIVDEMQVDYELLVKYTIAVRIDRPALTPINVDSKYSMSSVLSQKILDLNSVFTNNTKYFTDRIAVLTNKINDNRVKVEELSKKIANSESEKMSLQTRLMSEQIKMLREIQANPPRILEAEEILANHWQNELLSE